MVFGGYHWGLNIPSYNHFFFFLDLGVYCVICGHLDLLASLQWYIVFFAVKQIKVSSGTFIVKTKGTVCNAGASTVSETINDPM